MNVLEINNLNVAYSHQVVHDVSLSVPAGETVALVGESGSGKTTTAQSVLGLLPRGGRILSGSIRLSGTEIAGWSHARMAAIRGPRIGWVPQDPGNSLNPVKRIGESLAEVMRIHKRGTPEQIRTRVVELLERVGIPQPGARARQYPHQLSGGMKQRVLIASAIALAPELIIADEATSALDVTVQKSILDLLGDLRREQGTSILLVTHDLAVAADRAAQIAVLSQGRIVEAGRAADILTRPREPYTQTLIADAPAFTSSPRAPLPAEPAAEPVIEVRSLVKEFAVGGAPLRAVDDVSFRVAPGTTHALVGESGSGKTTTARAVMGFTPPTSGTVSVAGENPHRLGKAALRQWRAQIQMVYQNPFSSLNPRHTIEQIIAEPLRNFHPAPRSERHRRVGELLDAVALPADLAGRRPAELSGGQRQRVGIARALAPRPQVLVLDEATSALDVSVQAQILDLLADLQKEYGMTYLFISHDLAVVRAVADTVTVLSQGQAVESGPSETVFSAPEHPYTKDLLSAIPGRSAWQATLNPIHI